MSSSPRNTFPVGGGGMGGSVDVAAKIGCEGGGVNLRLREVVIILSQSSARIAGPVFSWAV